MSKKEQMHTRIGESRIMHNGMIATIVKYRKSTDIDVQFEDGTIVQHKKYSRFKDGSIGYPKK